MGKIFQKYLTVIEGLRVKPAMTTICALLPFLLVLSTVFVVSNHLANGIVSGKYFWFYAGMGLVGVSTLISTLMTKKSFRFSLVDLCILLFAGSVYLSALAWNDASQNTTKLTILALLVVLYFSFRMQPPNPLKGALRESVLCSFVILTGLVEAVWGLLQLYGFASSQHSLFKTTGSFFNPGPYAGYLAIIFPLALHYWVQGKRYKVQGKPTLHSYLFTHISSLSCIAILLVLPAAMSRASWLAVIGGSAIVLYSHYAKYLTTFLNGAKAKAPLRGLGGKFPLWGLGGLLVILVVASASFGMYSMKKNSADGRALTWKISLQVVAGHPFGVGLGNFSGAYGEAQADYFASGQGTATEELVAGCPEYGFNEYLQIMIESGIVSFLLFVVVLVLVFRRMIKQHDWGRMGALTALLIFAFFSYPFSVLPLVIVLIFLLAANTNCPAISKGWRLKPAMTSILCLLITSFCLYKQYPVYKAYKTWNEEQIYYHAGLYKDVAEDYAALYPYLKDQTKFLFEYARSLNLSAQPEKSNEVLQRATQISCDPMQYNIMGKNYQAIKAYKQAEKCFLKSTQIVPNRLYPWYLLCKLHAEAGNREKAREMAEIVLTKEPKVQSPAVREMREEVGKLGVESEE